MLAGVALFLLGLNFMEECLKKLAGRRFKLFLKKQTTNNFKAITGGVMVASILQSSSVVNLFILSMIGAGVIQMQNALAVMMGSNLGSTFYNWVVATLGFHFNIELIVLPVAGITGIVMALADAEGRLFTWCKLLFGFALLFIGLGFIKDGMEVFVQRTDLSAFAGYPLFVFLLVGFVLTAIVQSSSATLVLTLSALYANAINLGMAMAVVFGSEIGTTIKLFIASARGAAAKRQVAFGNFLFNCITVVIILLLLSPVKNLITGILKIQDKLLALVFFQSFINFSGIILFYPFLNPFSRFLKKMFAKNSEEGFFIHKAPINDTELALTALEKETGHFIAHVAEFSQEVFDIHHHFSATRQDKKFSDRTVGEKYDYIKQLHGEMHAFYVKLQTRVNEKADTERIEQLINACRNGMYAAKSIRDAMGDIEQMRNSSNDIKYGFYLEAKENISGFYNRFTEILNDNNRDTRFENLTALYHIVTKGYTTSLERLYKNTIAGAVSEIEISTLFNLNRELYTSYKSALFCLKDYSLSSEQAAFFDSLPGFIR